MPPPIAGNARVFLGRPPLPPAVPSTSSTPRFRRNAIAANLYIRLAGVVRPPVPPRRAPVDHTSTTSGIAAARSPLASLPLHPNPSAVHHRRLRSFSSTTSRRSPGSSSRGAASVVGIVAAWSSSSSSPCSRCRLSSSPPRRSRSSSSSSSSRRSRSSWRSSLRRAVLVRRPRSSSEPLQPRPRLRPRLRVAKPRAGRVSPLSKDRRRSRSLAVRLRRPRAVLAGPVRRCRSQASSRGGKDPSSRFPALVLSVSPRTRCAVVDPGTRVPVSVVVHACGW
ncbi:B1135C02.8 [Oryza sativa (japonica cultivar-group)]